MDRVVARVALVVVIVILWAGCGPRADAPALFAVAPARVCGSGGAALVLSGARFTPLPSSLLTDRPALDVPRVRLLARVANPAAPLELGDVDGGATPVRWISEAELDVTLPLDGLLAADYDVSVENPDGQRATLAAALAVVSGGALAIDAASPSRFCDAGGDQTVTLTGRGFQAATTVAILDGSGAARLAPKAALAGAALTFVVPKGSLAPGDYRVRLQNPPSAECVAVAEIAIAILPGPLLAQVAPPQICDTGGTLDLMGSGFVAGAAVTLTDAATGMSLAAATVTVVAPTHATAQFGANALAMNAQLDLTWRNPDGCASTLPRAVRLKPGNGNANCP